MKIAVKNLGPLIDAKVELGKLTVVCGANNWGKTYLAYIVYCYHRYCWVSNGYKHADLSNHPLVTQELMNGLMSKGRGVAAVDEGKLLDYCKRLHDRRVREFTRNLPEWFGAGEDDFQDAQVTFSFDRAAMAATLARRMRKLDQLNILNTSVGIKDGQMSIVSLNGPLQDDKANAAELVHKAFVKGVDWKLFRPDEPRPFIISGERTGITIFNKDLDISRHQVWLKLLEAKRNGEPPNARAEIADNTSKHVLPVDDELSFVRNLTKISRRKSFLHADPQVKFHRRIEELLMARYIRQLDETHLVSTPKNPRQFNVPIYQASSSARELCHLYFYLKCFALKGDLVIIDEPESHLSSRFQVELVRIIGACVNAGLSVLLSTHSANVLAELNNLIMLGHLPDDRKVVNERCKYYASHDGVRSEDVRAFYLDNGTVSCCHVDEWGIDVPSIDSQLYAIRDDSTFLGNRLLGVEDD